MIRRVLLIVVATVLASPAAHYRVSAAAPISYRFSFPEPQHRWMQVEATFPDLPSATLELRMSRSSPGRYSLHDFAKNVYDVHVAGADGRELQPTRPDPYGWNVADHSGRVTVRYKVFGDRVDGTYLGIDETHAHINMPAAIMWAHGLDDRPATVTFAPPSGTSWIVATQLHPGATRYEFTAPNLQYLMDSPAEFGPVSIHTFSVGGRTFRLALHHTGTESELADFVRDVEKIVRQEGAIYGEYPAYEPGTYTFLADYLPWASGDGMEHRNSTVITSSRAIATDRDDLLDTVAHEFFHCWNVERIRPRGLEPFDFDRANISGELWLAEGFTQYYGPLALQRAGLIDIAETARTIGVLVDHVTNYPGRRFRTAEEMSQMAPFIDGGRTVDRTNWSDTVISYYTFGGAIAVALDLSLRERSDGRITLDDFMRAMWRSFGKDTGGPEGYVSKPYTIADAERTLGEVAGDSGFAHDFFARYIQGHDLADYARLLEPAGFALRKRSPGHAWLGDLQFDGRNGGRIANLVSPTWPVYAAGLEEDDEIKEVDGQRVASRDDLTAVLRRHRPGDRVTVAFNDRAKRPQTVTVTLGEDPALDVVPIEAAGGALTASQRAFRQHWLGPQGPAPQPQP